MANDKYLHASFVVKNRVVQCGITRTVLPGLLYYSVYFFRGWNMFDGITGAVLKLIFIAEIGGIQGGGTDIFPPLETEYRDSCQIGNHPQQFRRKAESV